MGNWEDRGTKRKERQMSCPHTSPMHTAALTKTCVSTAPARPGSEPALAEAPAASDDAWPLGFHVVVFQCRVALLLWILAVCTLEGAKC